jgi:cytoskeletal protein RodZ
MKAEKIILSFVAVFVGLVAAGIAFYLYQTTKTVPPEQPKTVTSKTVNPTVAPLDSNMLSVETPKDETVSDKKVIGVSGKTVKNATIIVSTQDSDQVVKPADNGDFSLSQLIPDGTSILQIAVIFPNGQEKKITRTVTYSTESF